jgi:signal transduction histidine kinase
MDPSPIKVLLVDDDEDDYVIARDLLLEVESRRYVLDWVATYDAALEAFGRNQHDVYLIDYHLEKRDGLELLREALLLGCSAPLILLTGHGDHEVDIEAMRSGAADYLVKGQFDAALLERSIRYSVERRRVEDERAVLEQQLRQSQRMEAVGQLAGGIAHDFNNLLTAILGYAQMGGNMAQPESQLGTHFKEISKAARRATDLTRQLLTFSRGQIIEQRVLNLNDLVLNTHKMLRRLIGEDIELVTMTAPDLGLVRVDSSQIEQVLINLAINARDATPSGGKLTIETKNATLDQAYTSQHGGVAPGECVVLAVSDNGTGMSEDVKVHIFEPLFTTKKQGKGTGLGLSTCYGVVRQHGGHISVYSEPGNGTTIRIYLPRVDVDEAVGSCPLGGRSDQLPRGSEMVLLVEDEETVRGMSAHVLRGQGYTVLEAENGGEALRVAEQLDRGHIDLLLTDIVMPLMGGRELADRLRASHAITKVLYTSGYSDGAVISQGRLNPETEFISKPFTPESLVRRVREVLDLQ